ncbi:MAG: hypothetical protein GXX96_32615 [Planctomycetaceae bacterium]|nr:hypothetical protein [Planctomycetaceae bacterium]
MLVVALGSGWIVNERRKVWLEDRAVEEIERLGGNVFRESDGTHSPLSAALSYRQRAFGENCDRTVYAASYPPGVQREDLTTLGYLRALKRLQLAGACIGDEFVSEILRHRELEELDLSGTDVTDVGARQLIHLPKLKILYVDHTAVSDSTLTVLGKKSFEKLSCDDTEITSEGAMRFARMQHSLRHFEPYPAPSANHRNAARQLTQLGALLHTRLRDHDKGWRRTVTEVTIGDAWHGSPADLCYLSEIESLDFEALDAAACSEEYLAELARLDVSPGLEFSVEDTDRVSDASISPRSLYVLGKPKSLTSIRLCLPRIRKETLGCLPQVRHLQSVELIVDWNGASNIAVEAFEPLTRCDELKALKLSWFVLPRGTLELLSKS